MHRPSWSRASLIVLLLASVVGVTMTTAIDVPVSDAIFAAGGDAWPLPHAGWTRAVGYEGPKYVVTVFALFLLTGLIRPGLLHALRLEVREAAYLLACLAIVPATIAALRGQSGIACANQLLRYGGEIPDWLGHFTFARLVAADGPHGCFPSGHASGGFALLALGMLDRKPSNRRALRFAAILFGSYMGTYQLLRGAHFVSHVLASALIAQLIVWTLARYMLQQRPVTVTRQPSVPRVRPAPRRT